eukprot:CAMPEP_0116552982 /NCGR_PEP_ID=MMETSP0397-20121206/6793_1 /TAXON_ID=216820 /ORGANISM="Cyclophora tenuis, Strain ECT3854" /LENGTH=203 /DNA_ID=CAMNT_0004078001 /DNA_START=53 /DNA_END=664 /DNA_ORIENTATION=+
MTVPAASNVDVCPAIAPFFGYMGVAISVIFSNVGAAYGTAKAGVGIMISGISSPELVWRNLIPIIMAGVNGIYGLITAIILIGSMTKPTATTNAYSLYTGFGHFAAGCCCGLTAMGSGMAIGLAGDASVRSCGAFDHESKKQQLVKGPITSGEGGAGGTRKKKQGGGDQLFVAMVLIQVFAGNLGLYGLITSIIISQANYICV